MRRAGRGHRRLQLGLRPAALHDARGLLRHRPRRAGAHARVPRDGQGHQPGRPARGDGRGLQPHARRRAGPEVDPGPHRARLLPAARPGDRRGGDLDLLLEHRDRAPDDGQAAGRLRAHVGDAVQGRRLPLRPDGPPAQGADGASCGTRSTRSRAGATASTASAIYLYGEGWNFGEVADNARFVQATPAQHGRHRHRHVLRPAARRGPRRRPVRRRPGHAGLRQRAVHRPERLAGQRHAGRAARAAAALPGPDQGRARRQPARLPFVDSDGRRR